MTCYHAYPDYNYNNCMPYADRCPVDPYCDNYSGNTYWRGRRCKTVSESPYSYFYREPYSLNRFSPYNEGYYLNRRPCHFNVINAMGVGILGVSILGALAIEIISSTF